MAASNGGRRQIDTHSIFYTVTSSTSLTAGPAILFLHGLTCDSTDWSCQIPYLATTFPSSRIITLDFRHHGGSRPLSGPATTASIAHDTSIATLVSDCAAILTHLDVGSASSPTTTEDRAIVIGHSLGGLVTAELAHRHPNLVRGAVLVDPSYVVPYQTFVAFAEGLKSDFETTIAGFYDALYVPHTPELIKTGNKLRAWGRDKEVTIQGMQATVDAILEGCGSEDGGPVDFVRRRGRVEGVKRLTICSADKPYLDAEREVGLRGDGVDQIEVVEQGHWLAKTAPEEFNEILGRWLETTIGLARA